MEQYALLSAVIPLLVRGLAIVLGYLLLTLILRRLLIRQITRAAAQSATRWDDVLIAALRGPILLLIVISTVWVAGRFAGLPIGDHAVLDQVIRVGIIVAAIIFVDQFCRAIVDLYQTQLIALHLTPGLARAFVRIFIVVLGVLIVLDTLQISITPLLASLGIGGLAIGLALQGTLSNLFAGMQIISDQPIRVGDFIKLEHGEEGYVIEIGWRATRIRMLPNNTVIIPNSKVADSILINYHMPDREVAALVEVGVSYGSDLEHVERVTIAVAKETQDALPGAVRGFEPFIRYHTFDSSSINFTVILRAAEFTENYLIKHEFIKRLHARYRAEGIVIPFPVRTLNVPEQIIEKLRPSAGA
jgi:small-conductance mechanosensitive channel